MGLSVGLKYSPCWNSHQTIVSRWFTRLHKTCCWRRIADCKQLRALLCGRLHDEIPLNSVHFIAKCCQVRWCRHRFLSRPTSTRFHRKSSSSRSRKEQTPSAVAANKDIIIWRPANYVVTSTKLLGSGVLLWCFLGNRVFVVCLKTSSRRTHLTTSIWKKL